MDLSFLAKLVGPDWLASYTRGIVASACGFLVTKIPFASDVLTIQIAPGVSFQDAIAIAVAGLVVGLWGHLTKTNMPAAVTAMAQNVTKVLPFVLILTLSACANCPNCTPGQQFQANLSALNSAANKYGPIVGKDLIMVGNILYQMECSPALPTVTQVSGNVLKIVAPSSSSASKVTGYLQANADVAAMLCPLVASIKASVGSVPAGTPSQVISTAPTS